MPPKIGFNVHEGNSTYRVENEELVEYAMSFPRNFPFQVVEVKPLRLEDEKQREAHYWKGEYRNSVKKTPFGGTTFDDEFVAEMLNQVLSDMEKSELLPAAGPAQPRGPSDTPKAIRL